MITTCWAAKGGSGTTVVASSLALTSGQRTLLIDLAGDVPDVLGLATPSSPGVLDWLRSDAPPARLAGLEIAAGGHLSVLPSGQRGPVTPGRWVALSQWIRECHRNVVIDAGTGEPPAAIVDATDQTWLVTRACYLALRAAVRQRARPTGVVLIAEPGRALRRSDIEATLGAPVVTEIPIDPGVARAVDAGLLVARLPSVLRRPPQVAP
jgi:MinD superfamily P-loop ATPase